MELLGVSEDGKREPESVARTSGMTEVSQKIAARSDQLGSDSDINVEGIEMKQQQQQQCGEMACGTGSIPFESNKVEKHKQQVQADADVPQVLDYENQLSITK